MVTMPLPELVRDAMHGIAGAAGVGIGAGLWGFLDSKIVSYNSSTNTYVAKTKYANAAEGLMAVAKAAIGTVAFKYAVGKGGYVGDVLAGFSFESWVSAAYSVLAAIYAGKTVTGAMATLSKFLAGLSGVSAF